MVLGVKDTNEFEVTREYVYGDASDFADIANRPLDDLIQRTVDINRIFKPSRGFRVRQTDPTANTTVTIESGWYLSGVTPTNYAGTTHGPVAGTSAGNKFRIDLIYFNLGTGAKGSVTGAEAVSFAAAVRPTIPAGTVAIPLAYLYVDNTPTAFARAVVAANTAGLIEDIRPVPGSSTRVFESVAGNILQDANGGSVGTSEKIVRADHQHNLNVDATTPAAEAVASAGAVGTATTYARRDHVHPMPAAGYLQVAYFPNETIGAVSPAYNPGFTPKLVVVVGRTHPADPAPAGTFFVGTAAGTGANQFVAGTNALGGVGGGSFTLSSKIASDGDSDNYWQVTSFLSNNVQITRFGVAANSFNCAVLILG